MMPIVPSFPVVEIFFNIIKRQLTSRLHRTLSSEISAGRVLTEVSLSSASVLALRQTSSFPEKQKILFQSQNRITKSRYRKRYKNALIAVLYLCLHQNKKCKLRPEFIAHIKAYTFIHIYVKRSGFVFLIPRQTNSLRNPKQQSKHLLLREVPLS